MKSVNQQQALQSQQALAQATSPDPALTSQITTLQAQTGTLTEQLELRKHNLVWADPAVNNTTYLIQVFSIFRDTCKDLPRENRCFLKITAPPDSLDVAKVFATIAGAACRCDVFTPKEFNGDAAAEKDALANSTDEKVTIYASKDSKLWGQVDLLQFVLFTKVRYDPKDNRENFMWFQFGKGVRWKN